MRSSFVLVAIVAVLAPAADVAAQAAEPQKQPTAVGGGGGAATVEVLATEAAVGALRAGANAVDAAVVAAAVLGVTEPFSVGIGGGGFMVIRTSDGEVTTIDHREVAPAEMAPDSFFDGGRALAFNDARYSGLSVGVPGTVRGWEEALARYGTISLAEALAPAIEVARDGFVVDQVFFDQTQQNVDYFDDIESTRELYLDGDGTPRDVGTVFRNRDLARTYRRIGRLGADGFYRGPVARAMVEAVQRPPTFPNANHVWRPGLLTARDLRRYTAPEREPTKVGYRGLDVYGMGPPSSGGSTVGEALNILEGFDLEAASREQALHLMLEASRFSFADRNAYLADPDFFDVPLTGLLSDGFAAERRALIDPERAATSPVPPGDPYPFEDSEPGAGEVAATATRAGTTTHLTVSDRSGNVVSYTFTIEATGGNGIVVPGWGFLLNNELTDFNFDSLTHPNRVEAGKRPRSSMSPTIVTSEGRPVLAVGSPGGSTIITTVLQVLLDHLDAGMSLPEAIAEPRISQRNTATTSAEPAFLSSPEAAALRARGHSFTSTPEIGAVTGIAFLSDGSIQAAAEPVRRGGGSALVEEPRASEEALVTHGVAAGDVTSDSAVLWARADRGAVLNAVVTGDGQRRVEQLPVRASDDYTGQLVLEDLQPGTTYRYRIWFSLGLPDVGRGPAVHGSFRTAPADDEAAGVRLAFGGDVSGQNVCRDAVEGLPIMRTIHDWRPDIFVGLGDMIYADNTCEATGRYGNAQVPGTFGPAVDLESFWAHWRYNRADGAQQELLASTSYVGVWDDHEVVNDFGPLHDTRATPPYTPGVHLLPIGLDAFLDYTPISIAPNTPKRLYRSLRWGKNLELFVLDNRQYRDANSTADSPDRPKTMLGREQLTWFKEKLSASDATWKVIVSSVPMSIPTGFPAANGRDGWANFDQNTGFEQELLEILRFMQAEGIDNTVWITTDVHFGEVFRYLPFPDDPAFRVHEVVTGPLNAGIFPIPSFDETLNPERLFFFGPETAEAVTSWDEAKRWFNFGALEIDEGGALRLHVIDTGGESQFGLELAPE